MKAKFVVWLVLTSLTTCMGCAEWDFWNHSSPGLNVDTSKIGTGASVVTPIDDNRFWNGEPMDLRSRR
jgi:Ni,Fe-hydrogenase I small subunit